MVKLKENLIWQTFGRLTVIAQTEDYITPSSGKHSVRWLCECSCKENNEVIVSTAQLINGKTISCGCYRKEQSKQRRENYIKGNTCDLSGEYGVGYDCNNNEFWFDKEDYEIIKNYTWITSKDGYICTTIKGHSKKMHQILLNDICDHVNHNRFDNRRSNLRICTRLENSRNRKTSINNSSGVSGVSKRSNGKWRARIMVNNKSINLGTYEQYDDAVKARLQGEMQYYGEFAPQKDLFEQYNITNNKEE